MFFYCILLGESFGDRIFSYVPLWTIFSTLHLVYIICSVSWLLYWTFLSFTYPAILLCSLFQFQTVADGARWSFRKLLTDLHFFNDKIAFFDIPGLEFDTRTNGLMVIRGATLSLSTLTLVAHGVEVAVKLSEEIELAIQVEKVTVPLLRTIEIDDVYANVKGGDWEMTFGSLDQDEIARAREKEAFLVKDTPIVRAATMALEGKPRKSLSSKSLASTRSVTELADAHEALASVQQVSPRDQSASQKYKELLEEISSTSTIQETIGYLQELARREDGGINFDFSNLNDVRAAIAAQIQDHASLPHPPKQTIRLSTLRQTSHPNLKRFLHRLPLLYRLLLNPIASFHPVKVKSVAIGASGRYFKHLMNSYFWKHYVTSDPDIRRLENRISTWLSDANFVVELVGLDCSAQVPVNTNFDIETRFRIKDVMAYRTLPGGADLKQVVRIGGADAALTLPMYLFPHHEHIFPPKPTVQDVEDMEAEVFDMRETPQGVQAATALDQLKKDEANMRVSAHAHLPAHFHQDLLNFIAAVVKATKVIETDKDFEEIKNAREERKRSKSLSSGSNTPKRRSMDSDVMSVSSNASNGSSASTITATDGMTTAMANNDPNSSNFKAFLRKVDTGLRNAGVRTRDEMRKAGLSTASAMANDRWIAKLVGKAVRKLEKAQGEVGYSMNVPLQLWEWRESEKWEDDSKLLP